MSKSAGKTAKARSGAKRARPAAVQALERSPSHLLHLALQLALDVYAGESGTGGLTQRQYALLAAVDAYPQPSQTDLVRATGIDRSTLADLVARLTAKGWLARERSERDGRANVVKLTDEGRAALDGARPQAAAADARILGALGPGKRDAFITALQKLARAGEAQLLAEPAMGEAGTSDGAAPQPKKPKKADKPPKAKKHKKARSRGAAPVEGAADDATSPPISRGPRA